MRLSILLSALAIGLASISFAEALGDRDIARPGRAYATPEVRDADACARACEDDSICMAWTYEANACALTANVSQPILQSGALSGLSSRAPAFARRAPLPTVQIAGVDIPATSPLAQHVEARAQVTEAPEVAELLGGPLGDEDLKPTLGSQN